MNLPGQDEKNWAGGFDCFDSGAAIFRGLQEAEQTGRDNASSEQCKAE